LDNIAVDGIAQIGVGCKEPGMFSRVHRRPLAYYRCPPRRAALLFGGVGFSFGGVGFSLPIRAKLGLCFIPDFRRSYRPAESRQKYYNLTRTPGTVHRKPAGAY
jgi:hypothetical protein